MNIVILDDNKYVVELLRKQLNWEAFGITEIIGCFSVKQAQKVFLQKEIDFLISDIEMPGQNGFVLLEWLKIQGMSPETVLLTSYADFSYAQRAIKYQCSEYLLKPVERTVLEETMSRLVSRRLEYKKQKRLQEYGNDWISHLSLVKEMFWRDIFGEEAALKKEELMGRIEKDRLPYDPFKQFAAVLICLEEEKEGFGRELLSFTCENVLHEITGGYNREMEYLAYNGYCQFVAVFALLEEEDYDLVTGIMKRFIEVFMPFYHAKVTCYISESSSILKMNAHLRHLEEYYLDNLNREKGLFLEADFGKKEEIVYYAPEIEEWRNLLLCGKTELLESQINAYFEHLKATQVIDDKLLQALLTDWNMLLVSVLKECNITTYQVVTRFRNRELEEVAVCSIACMEKLILSEAQKIAEQINYVEKEDAIIEDIKAYVITHLDGVTRSQIASEFYLSPNYLSKLFKKQAGISLSDFIQKERMSQAKKLLLEKDLSISRIAEQVGYPSFAHFSKQFKRINGMSPNEYRKKTE